MTDSEQHRPEIVVGLVATPPDYPARVAARLTAELADRLPERGGAGGRGAGPGGAGGGGGGGGWGGAAPRRRRGGAARRYCPPVQRRPVGRRDLPDRPAAA